MYLRVDTLRHNGERTGSFKLVFSDNKDESISIRDDSSTISYNVTKSDYSRLTAAAILAVDKALQKGLKGSGQGIVGTEVRVAQVSLIDIDDRVLRTHWLGFVVDASSVTFTKLCEEFEKGVLCQILQIIAADVDF
jgi:hypothetical protein